jgi:hypothetical protein
MFGGRCRGGFVAGPSPCANDVSGPSCRLDPSPPRRARVECTVFPLEHLQEGTHTVPVSNRHFPRTFPMPKTATTWLAAIVALACPSPAFSHSWDSGDTAALIGGALLGGAAAAAISNQHKHEYQYAPPPPSYSPPRPPFSPTTGVVCYPSQWACYNNNGHFNAKWTNRVF